MSRNPYGNGGLCLMSEGCNMLPKRFLTLYEQRQM